MTAISSLWERLVRRVMTGAAAGAGAAAAGPGGGALLEAGAVAARGAAPGGAARADAAPGDATPAGAAPAAAAPAAAVPALGWPVALDVPAGAWEIPEEGGEVVPLAAALPPAVDPAEPDTGAPAAEGPAGRRLCLWCLGSGQVSTPAPCPACAGAGEGWCEGIALVCPACHGTRRLNGPCPSCGGAGWVAGGSEQAG